MPRVGSGLEDGVSLKTPRRGGDKGCIPYRELPLSGTHRQIFFLAEITSGEPSPNSSLQTDALRWLCQFLNAMEKPGPLQGGRSQWEGDMGLGVGTGGDP